MPDELLTPAEFHVLDLLRRATDTFLNLPEHHPSDRLEWAVEVHRLQERVMCRAAIRAYPDQFTPLGPDPDLDDEGTTDG